VRAKGQITLPVDIRRSLMVNDGDKVTFIENDGKFVIVNPTALAFENAQKAFKNAGTSIFSVRLKQVNRGVPYSF
jgi:AbrB family looped-hinge helix DNA binding protein